MNLIFCPFCGAKEGDTEMCPDTGCDEPSIALHTWTGNKNTYVVQCCRCGCSGPLHHTYQSAIKEWNHRASDEHEDDCSFHNGFHCDCGHEARKYVI